MKNAAYSHGLEKIYAFETVNPQTVRTLHVKQPELLVQPQRTLPLPQKQLLFSFATELPSLRLKEPIEVLQLSTFTQKGLLTAGKKTVEEALELIDSKERSFKGLGQGHIEEIRSKLSSYLRPCASPSIDFSALCRILCHCLDPKERFVLLSDFGLQSLFSISTSEIQEVERWSASQKRQVFQKAIETCKKTNNSLLLSAFEQIKDSYFASWIQKRHGFINHLEFMECLKGLSNDPDLFENVIQLLTLFSPIPELILYSVEPNVYAINDKIKKEFISVRDKALSYFYQPFATYPIEKLTSFIKKDFAQRWIGFEEGFIEKVLMSSSLFVYGNKSLSRSML